MSGGRDEVVVVGYQVPAGISSLLRVVAIAALAASCVASGASGSAPATTTAPSSQAVRPLPVDTTLAPVSASAPGADAMKAMTACGVDPRAGTIAGMALVPSGADVAKYAPMHGTEPELKTGGPVWVIQLKGDIPGRVGTLVDPTCVVVGGIPTTYLTHGAIDNGVRWTAAPVKSLPALRLPPLAP